MSEHGPGTSAFEIRQALQRRAAQKAGDRSGHSGLSRRALSQDSGYAVSQDNGYAGPARIADEAEDWVISYMDMVTLLMIVFLTLVGMLWVDKKTRPTVVNVLQIETGQMPRQDFSDAAIPAPFPQQQAAQQQPAQQQAANLPPYATISPGTQMAVDHWVQAIRQNGLDQQVQLQVQENRVSIAIRDRLLFGSGQSDIQDAGQSVIRRLASLLRDMPGTISVEGHTDTVPIQTERYPSNWELSAGRAAAVVRALAETGLPANRLRAIGYGDSRPVARGNDEASRAQNRRVTLVVEDQR
ncbi:OmpA family protein [Ferrovibrio sp.]|uniref:OmpA/MotB family protein n=1 Tax=Ferrovibrio sp. TaxID=1917215 RepID=UPI0025BACFAB|nr:OmpA family protein [Ferrovibrio sp.]MBX3453849.1 OmpA family protein [Ferrovibrio sp.]